MIKSEADLIVKESFRLAKEIKEKKANNDSAKLELQAYNTVINARKQELSGKIFAANLKSIKGGNK